jgi:hypothetical protein
MERLVVTARLKDGAAAEAERLLTAGPPFDPWEEGMTRHAAYLTASEVVFLFEGPSVEWAVEAFVNDPSRSTALAAWYPLVDGPPRVAREVYHWTKSRAES